MSSKENLGEEKMLKIGDFSKLSRISIRMLRHYDEIGLLVPKSTDPFTSYRYYGEDQLPIAGRIDALKQMGFSLAVIREILNNYDDPKALYRYLEIKQIEVNEQVSEMNRRMLLLETAIKRLRKDNTAMNYNVTLKTLPKRYVASVRKVIEAYNKEELLWNILITETKPLNLQTPDNCYSLAIFHDESYKENNVDVEIQITVKGNYDNTDNVVFKTISPIEIASATFKGSYEEITKVNYEVANWINDNGYEFNGPMFCIYHISPAQTQNPDELVTEVCYPINKK